MDNYLNIKIDHCGSIEVTKNDRMMYNRLKDDPHDRVRFNLYKMLEKDKTIIGPITYAK